MVLSLGNNLLPVEEVTKLLQITPRTLHYYEEIGLVTPTARTDGGHRLYSKEAIERFEHILRLKGTLSYTLKEIREILEAEDTFDRLRTAYNTATVLRKKEILTQSIHLMSDLLETIQVKKQQLITMEEQFSARLTRLHNAMQELED